MSDNHADVSGVNNSFYGLHHTDEYKKQHSKFMSGKYIGSSNPNWKGGFDKRRSYILPKWRCIQLNSYFKGSAFHHINKSIGVFIPLDLHKHLYHDIRTGQNMREINMLSIQFINGGL